MRRYGICKERDERDDRRETTDERDDRATRDEVHGAMGAI